MEVFVIMAKEYGEHTESVYAVTATEEIAEAIIEKDEQDGQIEEGAFTVKMFVHEKMTTV